MLGLLLVVRKFRLFEELEKGEKVHGNHGISYGLDYAEDMTLAHWNRTILGPLKYFSCYAKRVREQNLFPKDRMRGRVSRKPPTIILTTKIDLPCVNPADGKVGKRVCSGETGAPQQLEKQHNHGGLIGGSKRRDGGKQEAGPAGPSNPVASRDGTACWVLGRGRAGAACIKSVTSRI